MTPTPNAAQQLYEEMLERDITPALHANGFTGSHGALELPCDNAWALLGFQKWRPTTAVHVGFTVNLSFFERATWVRHQEKDPSLPAAPEHNVSYGTWAMTQRIGYLMPKRADHWWNLMPGMDAGRLARDVNDSLLRYGAPWLRSQIARNL